MASKSLSRSALLTQARAAGYDVVKIIIPQAWRSQFVFIYTSSDNYMFDRSEVMQILGDQAQRKKDKCDTNDQRAAVLLDSLSHQDGVTK
ncbi:hypothetical protein CCP3SC5AM1_720009 [Gammaproteobacteria bacterium]